MRQQTGAAWWFANQAIAAAVAGALLLCLCAAAAGGEQAPRRELAEADADGAAVLEGGYRLCPTGYGPCTCGAPHGAHSKHDNRQQAPYAELSYTDHRGSGGRRFCCCPVALPRVLVIYADDDAFAADVQAKLSATGAFVVEVFNGRVEPPTLAKLQQYDAVLVFGTSSWADSEILGRTLAKFWDAGGGVVVSYAANTGNDGIALAGTWASAGYALFKPAPAFNYGPTSTITFLEPTSPLLDGVTSLTTTDAYQTQGTVVDGAITVATWGTDPERPLIVRGTKPRPDGSTGNLVELNFYVVSASFVELSGGYVGDGAQIMRNSLLFSMADATP